MIPMVVVEEYIKVLTNSMLWQPLVKTTNRPLK